MVELRASVKIQANSVKNKMLLCTLATQSPRKRIAWRGTFLSAPGLVSWKSRRRVTSIQSLEEPVKYWELAKGSVRGRDRGKGKGRGRGKGVQRFSSMKTRRDASDQGWIRLIASFSSKC